MAGYGIVHCIPIRSIQGLLLLGVELVFLGFIELLIDLLWQCIDQDVEVILLS